MTQRTMTKTRLRGLLDREDGEMTEQFAAISVTREGRALNLSASLMSVKGLATGETNYCWSDNLAGDRVPMALWQLPDTSPAVYH